jgi:CRISPR type III-A-associated RAMP protein Csm4
MGLMKPGLAVKLHPTGPWRIGADSGARNRVDAIYHSDSLYSAIASAMARMGSLEEWLDATARATARAGAPLVCFSSCFPFVEEIQFVAPPRTVWPPRSPALMSAHVRWKSARFVPLRMVRTILTGKPLDENRWSVDGESGCLMPAKRQGPFRAGVRWNAAVDRLTGATDRHSVGCIEFRPGCGLWTVVAFADDAARDRWLGPVKAAFRWLADSGFGGERSRGWGRAEAPEFVEGRLPGMILAQGPDVWPPPVQEPPTERPPIQEPPEEPQLPDPDPEPQLPPDDPDPRPDPFPEPLPAAPALAAADSQLAPGDTEPLRVPSASAAVEPPLPPGDPDPQPASLPAAPALAAAISTAPGLTAHWLLSLFSPAAADAVEWSRGSYTLLERGGRVESPAGSGALKKLVHMVSEGSVLYAPAAPHGAAPDVAPEGFAHPVFRAGFALAIPLPEGS